MRKLIALLSAAVLILLPFCLAYAEGDNIEAELEEAEDADVNEYLPPLPMPEEPQWTGITSTACRIYEAPDKESTSLYRIPQGKRFRMYAYYPSWAYVEFEGVKGYIRRNCIESAQTIDDTKSPPYGVDFYPYSATVRIEAPVMSEPDEASETLITLYDGARIALLGFENGWGKLIYHRQYGYINSNNLYQIIPTYPDTETAGTDRPISAFVSFYKITTDENNLGRMTNIAVACKKMSAIVFQEGQSLDFNAQIGPYTAANGYEKAIVLIDGTSKVNYGGGTCQVSSTLYNAVLQLPGLTVVRRTAHGPSGASYLPHGVDAAVGNTKKGINFIFRNDYSFPVRIDASSQDGALYISIYKAE